LEGTSRGGGETPPGSQAERIAATVRDEILRGQYREGERLPSERDLAQRFGTTRGSVREAIKKLEQLGLACVRPGGVRVAPRHDASLDVVTHLLHLETPPDPVVVDQVVEALGVMSVGAARLAMERAPDAEIERARGVVARMQRPESPESALSAFRELTDLFVAASGNLVLQIVRRGLRTQLTDHVKPRIHERHVVPPELPLAQTLTELDAALAERDGSGVARALETLLEFLRNVLRERLQAAREEARMATRADSPSSQWLGGVQVVADPARDGVPSAASTRGGEGAR
jgi:GntR family transcriptional repressor for pyruvate dehydrogenase complex